MFFEKVEYKDKQFFVIDKNKEYVFELIDLIKDLYLFEGNRLMWFNNLLKSFKYIFNLSKLEIKKLSADINKIAIDNMDN